MTFIGFHYFYRQCGLLIYTQPAQNSMRGPATAPHKEISGPRPPRPASENLIQARASPRAAGARGPRGAGQPMQGFSRHQDIYPTLTIAGYIVNLVIFGNGHMADHLKCILCMFQHVVVVQYAHKCFYWIPHPRKYVCRH